MVQEAAPRCQGEVGGGREIEVRSVDELDAVLTRLEASEFAKGAAKAAPKEAPGEQAPCPCAITQNDVASTLLSLGTRESGTTRLEEAITATRRALEEWTRDQTPYHWTYSEKMMGNALAAIAERPRIAPRMEEAIASVRSAAGVFQQTGDADRSSEAQSRISELEAELAALRH